MINIIVQLSKYIMIALMAAYTFSCFSIFAGNYEDEERRVLIRQDVLIFMMQFIAFAVMYLTTDDMRILFIYAALMIVLLGVILLYSLIYPNVSKLVVNNMCMLITVGMIMITRLSADNKTPYGSSIRQLVFVVLGVAFGLVVPILIRKLTFLDKWTWIYAGIGGAALLAVALFAPKSGGAQLGFKILGFNIQPSEFVKFTTALALARYMSSYSFDIRNLKHLLHVAILLGLPVLIVMLQNDTGSALVFGSFLFMLYREGFNGWVYIALIMIISLFIFSFLLEPTALLIVLILVCVVGEGMTNGNWRSKAIYLAGLALGSTLIYTVCQLLLSIDISWYLSILIATTLSIGVVILYAYRYKINNILTFILLFFGSLGFTYTVDYVFNNVLQIHQQKRILDLLGLESDLSHWGYNVNQSKIAIGSGGFSGKGFLEGTQTKFNFVPEQSTDFIFCTVGEEWGFIGSAIVIILFVILILRLIRMGERQQEPFGRIYCYCVASVFLFHITINIGMTIGIMPVIGIPLPFFSYGGSSLIAFTILLFVAIKLDASKHNELPFVN